MRWGLCNVRDGALRLAIFLFFCLGLALAVLGWWLPAGWRGPLAVAYLIGGPLALLGMGIARLVLSLRALRETTAHNRPAQVRRREWPGVLGTLRVEDVDARIRRDRII